MVRVVESRMTNKDILDAMISGKYVQIEDSMDSALIMGIKSRDDINQWLFSVRFIDSVTGDDYTHKMSYNDIMNLIKKSKICIMSHEFIDMI